MLDCARVRALVPLAACCPSGLAGFRAVSSLSSRKCGYFPHFALTFRILRLLSAFCPHFPHFALTFRILPSRSAFAKPRPRVPHPSKNGQFYHSNPSAEKMSHFISLRLFSFAVDGPRRRFVQARVYAFFPLNRYAMRRHPPVSGAVCRRA